MSDALAEILDEQTAPEILPPLPEINLVTYETIDAWRDFIATSSVRDRLTNYKAAATDLYVRAYQETSMEAFRSIENAIELLGSDFAELPMETVFDLMIEASTEAKLQGGLPAPDKDPPADDRPPVESREEFQTGTAVAVIKPRHVIKFEPPPLSIDDWISRDLLPPDFMLGDWLSTTTRGLLVAPTGLGKTNFAMALGLHAAAGVDFLHWRGRRPCTVLYIDGEMSRRLLRQRLADATARLGMTPAGFHVLSAEDVEGFAPLNTPAGQAYVNQVISHLGKPDLIIFDSIMCLTIGDMKDGEAWSAAMPWVRSLTRQCIGQIWVHHTGHDESRSYGDKTKEWQLDTVMHMEPIAREDTDVSFSLEFRKARERTPTTRGDFQTARIALLADQWTVEATGIVRQGHVSPLGLKFLDALHGALASDNTVQHQGRRAATLEHWKAEGIKTGLLDSEKPDSARTLFNKHKRELIAGNMVACNEQLAWLV